VNGFTLVNRYLFWHSLIVSALIIITGSYFTFGWRVDTLITPACWVTVALVTWILLSWIHLTHDIFDLYFMFLLATVSFNSGQIFLQIFDLNLGGLLNNKFVPTLLWETILFINLSLACIHLGALAKLSQSDENVWNRRMLPAPFALLQVGLALVAVSLIPTLLIIRELVDVVRKSGYFGIYQRVDQIGFANALAILAAFFVPGLLFTLAGSLRFPRLRRWTEIALISHAVIFLALGRRGDGAETLITYTIVRNYCIEPIKKTILIPAGIFLIVIVFPLLAVVRNVSLDDRADLGLMLKAYQSIDNPAAAALSEMGGSMQSISYTIDLVPRIRPFDLGGSYFYAALSVVPNFFWKLHPSVTHGSPSVWLVNTVEPDIAEKRGGIGFSYIAEAFLNFGWWGSPILLAAFGYWICGLVKWSQFTGSPARIAMVASFFSSLLTFTRADSQSVVRPLFWYALAPYLLVRYLEKRERSQPRLNKSF